MGSDMYVQVEFRDPGGWWVRVESPGALLAQLQRFHDVTTIAPSLRLWAEWSFTIGELAAVADVLDGCSVTWAALARLLGPLEDSLRFVAGFD